MHKEALVDLGVKLWESTSCVGVTSRVKHARVRKTLTQACDLIDFLRVSLAKLKVVWRGLLWAKQATIFIGKEG